MSRYWLLGLLLFVSNWGFCDSWAEVSLFMDQEKVLFPGNPEHFQKIGEQNMHYDVYISQEGAMTFLAVVVPLDKAVKPPEAAVALEGFMSGILRNGQNQLQTADLIQVEKLPALAFLIKNERKYFQGRTIMSDNHMVLLAVEYADSDHKKPQIEKFIGSFFLKKQ